MCTCFQALMDQQISNKLETVKPEIGKVTFGHTDTRRRIDEYNGSNFAFTHFDVKSIAPLGEHYHAEKTETFVILKGGGIFLSCPVNEQGERIGEIEKTRIERNSVVSIPPFVAHTFVLEEGTEMICFSSARFDENNKDLLPCKLT